MRIALIADIHSNIIALEAVIKAIKKHQPDRILSLGDQVNLGPCPKETLALLKAENVTCLHGNHERYVLAAMAGDPAYAGANFAAPRFHASLLTQQEITFPHQLEIEGITFCHAMPGDDRFPVYDPKQALPLLRGMHFDKPTHIICGHGHNPSHIRSGNMTIDSIGSLGCMDDGAAGTAPFVILTVEQGQTMLRPYYTAYSAANMKDAFIRSGMADACPIMAHISCLQMMHNQEYLVRFASMAQQLSRRRGEEAISSRTWQDVDEAFDWPDGMNTAAFWKK